VRHERSAVGGRRGTPTRRPPRRSPLVAHPRSATGNAGPGACNPWGDPGDQAHNDEAIRPAATRAALGAASGLRPEPLTRPPDTERQRDVSAGSVAETHSDMYQGTLARRFLAALRAAPRLSRPTDRHQTRTRSQPEPVEQLQDARTARRDSACGKNRAQPSGPRSGGPGYRLIASFTQRATERGTSCSIVSSALSRTLVVRRSRAARLGGAGFDAQHVDVDQARLVSVEL
jgi:hypothetical protein